MMGQAWLLLLVALMAASSFWVIAPLLSSSKDDDELSLTADKAERLDLEDARIQLEDDRLMDRVPDQEYEDQRNRIKGRLKVLSQSDKS